MTFLPTADQQGYRWAGIRSVVTPGIVAGILSDVDTVAVLVLLAVAGLAAWWVARRGSGSRRAETRLRQICLGNAAQMERLIEVERARAPGISRTEAATRAVLRYERDNR